MNLASLHKRITVMKTNSRTQKNCSLAQLNAVSCEHGMECELWMDPESRSQCRGARGGSPKRRNKKKIAQKKTDETWSRPGERCRCDRYERIYCITTDVLKVIPIKLKRAWEANTTVIVVSKGGLFGHLFCLDKFGKNNLWSPDTSHRVVQRMILTAFGMAGCNDTGASISRFRPFFRHVYKPSIGLAAIVAASVRRPYHGATFLRSK
jgi:hypothetical protein